MPIRFRCAYCNQLMGIARRKAGTVVRCPKCAGEVIVPGPEPQAAAAPGRLNQMFEAVDFGKDFADVPPAPPPNPLLPPPPYSHPPLLDAAPSVELPPTRSAEALPDAVMPSDALPGSALSSDAAESRSLSRPGVFLTVPMLIGAGTALLVLVAVVFLLGFFLGRSTLP